MTWEGFTQWLTNITNNPAFIAVVTVLGALGSVFAIISKTSLGRKAIRDLTNISRTQNEHIKNIQEAFNNNLRAVNAKVIELSEEKDKFLKEVDNKYKTFVNQFDFYETQMLTILSLIPNAKVQEQVKLFREEWETKKKDIEEFVGVSYSEIDARFKELTNKIEELTNGRNDDSTESKEI